MTSVSIALLVSVITVALVNLWAVGICKDPETAKKVESFTKPLVMVVLFVLLWTLDLDGAAPTARWWFAFGVFGGLLGDVFLMLEDERFIEGLVSFLIGHIAYVVGLVVLGVTLGPLLAGVGIVAFGVLAVGFPLMNGIARGSDHFPTAPHKQMVLPVAAYMAVISAMVIAGTGTGIALAIIGALLFYTSDAILAWDRFIRPVPKRSIAVMSTYHAAQILLVCALTAA